jgi:uncharacterized protein YgiM (DUF1202 family)
LPENIKIAQMQHNAPIKQHFNVFLSLVICLIPILSCGQEDTRITLELPETPLLSIEKYFGVVDFGFLRVRREPTGDSDMVTIIRGGTIVEILRSNPQEVVIDGQTGRWYEILYRGTRGWVFGPYLMIFDSLEKAQNAAKDY